jgi:type II secretory ATPase GspE/PulE/Tfp pilus assembly ATPase PilB-like protein
LRVATIPTAGGNEDVVMRILAAGEPLPLDKMGMNERDYNEFLGMIEKPYGIVLVVGHWKWENYHASFSFACYQQT